MQERSHFLLAQFGHRSLEDETLYVPAEDPLSFGIQFAQRFGGSPFGMEGGFSLAVDEDEETILGNEVDNASLFAEGDLGLRAMVDVGPLQFFAGAGAALVWADIESEVNNANVLSEHDSSVGVYAHAGVLWSVVAGFLMGLEARTLRGTEIEFRGFPDTDADYTELAFLVGWSPAMRRR